MIRNYKVFKIVLIVFFLFVFSSLIPLPSSLVQAAVPHLINYQGRLTDSSGNPLTGSYAVTFRIYDAQTAGTLLWEETYTSLVIDKGLFSVLLGSVANLDIPFDKPYWLEIKVGTEVMTPRQQITSSGYAIRAETAETIADSTFLVPQGAIMMWSGSIASIPTGWVLCDGTNGTPNLKDRFIVGAGNNYSIGAAGGSATHTHPGTHTHVQGWDDGGGWRTGNVSESSPGVTEASSLPPYYALAYIMKS